MHSAAGPSPDSTRKHLLAPAHLFFFPHRAHSCFFLDVFIPFSFSLGQWNHSSKATKINISSHLRGLNHPLREKGDKNICVLIVVYTYKMNNDHLLLFGLYITCLTLHDNEKFKTMFLSIA